MTLDNLLKILDLAMRNKISEIDASKLKDSEVNLLNAFFIEKEKRPELVSSIQIPELMHDYLSLSLEERSELRQFGEQNPEYLDNKGKSTLIRLLKSKEARKIAQKTRWTKQLIGFFDFYLEDHEEGVMFNPNYLKTNKQLKKEFGNLGRNLCENTVINLRDEGGIDKITELASHQHPEIKDYWDYKKQNKFDINQAVQDSIKIFDFYLRNRKEGEVFNSNYLGKNKKLKQNFKNLGKNLYRNAIRNLKEGGIQKIVELASQQRPEIKQHTTATSVLKIDGPKQLIRIFDFYLTNREENEILNSDYLTNNKKLKKEFGNLGERIYRNTNNHLQEEGGIQKIIELASQQRPELRKYTTLAGILKIDGPKQLIRIFDFYLENRKKSEIFNAKYLQTNKKLKQKFKNLGHNLYQNANKHLKKEDGIQNIIELATQERPEILEHWHRKQIKFNLNQAVQNLIKIFDFYLKNCKKSQIFNSHYLQANKELKKRFGNLGKNLYQNAIRNLKKEDGIQNIIELATQERPEILEHWSYKEINKFDTEQAVQDFIKIFGFYLENREEGEVFNSNYLKRNEQLKNKFGNLGVNLYENARNNFRKEGGINKIVELTSQQHPKILNYWGYRQKQ